MIAAIRDASGRSDEIETDETRDSYVASATLVGQDDALVAVVRPASIRSGSSSFPAPTSQKRTDFSPKTAAATVPPSGDSAGTPMTLPFNSVVNRRVRVGTATAVRGCP